eukprot:TRINITY_DN641_c0_g1_i3.p1 TRINITY_DN641_c0_g1~~TRINITY_DN641_c0_g1_i3.p1  ORF type:complete len:319 (-),score=62.05 TRINITY_DN641_c0_g1_i3:299-1255(-)
MDEDSTKTDDSKSDTKSKKKEVPKTAVKTLIKFNKNFYREVPEIARMTPEEVAAYRETELENVRVRGKKCPKPVKEFSQCGLSIKVASVMKKKGYNKPTAIQAQALPAILSGKDVIGIARTGSGKTLAFLLPMLRHIKDQPPLENGDGPIGLIIAPARELVVQIHKEASKFARALGLRTVCITGGQGSFPDQISKLKRGSEIVVCTPGRMIDLLCTNGGRIVNLNRVTFLVIDEADRMFDLGFEGQITKIIENTRKDRQTVMFSATFPPTAERVARNFLKNPLEITVGGRAKVCSDVEQHVEVLPNKRAKFVRGRIGD